MTLNALDLAFFLCRAERDERNLDREIRNEQEQAFQETLRRDQEREQRIAEEDLKRQEEAAEEERKRQEEEMVRKAELDRFLNFVCLSFHKIASSQGCIDSAAEDRACK